MCLCIYIRCFLNYFSYDLCFSIQLTILGFLGYGFGKAEELEDLEFHSIIEKSEACKGAYTSNYLCEALKICKVTWEVSPRITPYPLP